MKTLEQQKIQVEAEIAVAEATRKGLELDLDVVAGLIRRGVSFDRKLITFLVQYAKAGDVGEYLKNLLTKMAELSVEDEGAVTRINSAIKRATKAFDDFQERSVTPPPRLSAKGRGNQHRQRVNNC